MTRCLHFATYFLLDRDVMIRSTHDSIFGLFFFFLQSEIEDII